MVKGIINLLENIGFNFIVCPACLGDKLSRTRNKCYRCDGKGYEEIEEKK